MIHLFQGLRSLFLSVALPFNIVLTHTLLPATNQRFYWGWSHDAGVQVKRWPQPRGLGSTAKNVQDENHIKSHSDTGWGCSPFTIRQRRWSTSRSTVFAKKQRFLTGTLQNAVSVNEPIPPVRHPAPLHRPLWLAFPILKKRDKSIFLIRMRSLFKYQSCVRVKWGFIYARRLEGLPQREFSSPGDK